MVSPAVPVAAVSLASDLAQAIYDHCLSSGDFLSLL
jgi:hypothetical protein